jgi:RNA polymerase sigma factor (sigma-70 family)
MMTTELMNAAECNDADLVAESLGGSRDAFRQIVERYQTLICSLAYSATGNMSQSEDVAQETFLAAWTDLRSLREPEKLRSWLCGIVRNRIHRSLRSEGREPVCGATALEEAHESPALEALPSEQTISREEEAILWRSLEKIPSLYREPLILFYRQHQSVEHVAEALELSQDSVKQRLARGRKMLQEEVQAFVENTLRRTAPGQAFSGAVFAALPLVAGPAATAGLGMGAKGTAAAKSGFVAAWLAPLAPFLGIAAGAGAQCLLIRAGTTDRKLRARKMAQVIVGWVVVIGLAWGGENTMRSLGRHFQWDSRTRFVALAGFWWFYMGALITWMYAMARRGLSMRLTNEMASEHSQPGMMPMKPGLLAAVVAGVHLALFSWLVRVAWNANDLLGAWAIAGTVVVLGVLAFVCIRGKTGAEAARAGNGHLGLCFVVMMLAINLRMDVWVASAYGVTVAEAHRLQPLWIVPALTLALVAWVGVLSVLIRPKPRLGQQ